MTDLLLTLPPDNSQAKHVRAAIRRWSTGEHLADRLLDDTLLVASELFSNAVRASVGSLIGVMVRSDDGAIVVETTNIGPGFDPAAVPAPSIDHPGGRGIAISRALGSVVVEQAGSTTVVRVALSGV